MEDAISLDAAGIYLVLGPAPWSRLLAICDSARGGLIKAYELSGKATHPFYLDSPSKLVQVGTDAEMDAHQIMACWRELGLPLPPH
jgi:hypothetical protein